MADEENGRITIKMVYDLVTKLREETHEVAKKTVDVIHNVDSKVTRNEIKITGLRDDLIATDNRQKLSEGKIESLQISSNRWDGATGLVGVIATLLASIGLINK